MSPLFNSAFPVNRAASLEKARESAGRNAKQHAKERVAQWCSSNESKLFDAACVADDEDGFIYALRHAGCPFFLLGDEHE